MENFNNIIYTNEYTGEYKIFNVCLKLYINICINKIIDYSTDYLKYEYEFKALKSNRENYNPFIPLTLIGWINNNQYELLLSINIKHNNLYNPLANNIVNNNISYSPEIEINKAKI